MNLDQARNSSKSFYLAFQRNMEQRTVSPGQVQLLVVPAVVCAAFSIELGLKALLLQAGKQASGHKLAELFAKLESPMQQVLVEGVGLDKKQFSVSLEAASYIFVEWRYLYEKDSANADIEFLSKLAGILQGAIGSAR